ncbi:MAG: NAD(P)H-binding protein [Bryobacteraceae bacterium]
MEKLGILGAGGAIGQAVAGEARRRSLAFCVIGRSSAKLEAAFPGAEVRVADVGTESEASSALEGVHTAIYAVGVPYHEFRLHPVLMRATLSAARHAGVRRLIVISSVYSYGVPQTPRVAETHPRTPAAFKGKMRKEQEDAALAADDAGGLRTLVLRLPDFYGPHTEVSIAGVVLGAALRNVAAPWLGPPDLPHEFIFVPDAAGVILDLAGRDDVWGQAWNLGGAGTITPRQFIETTYRELGLRPRMRNGGKWFLRLGGLFSKVMGELREMYYLQETPVILDDSRLAARLGPLPKTPYAEGIARTVNWARAEMASRSR